MSRYVQNLISWYNKNSRELPWRKTTDSYAIWISEIMLQQTRAVAVIPYFEKFMHTFPSVEVLASAEESQVLQHWAGLGYYSRARNIHKAAKQIHEKGAGSTWQEWITLPGLGPYTARAVASFAFGEPVGVLDGNVIRVLSRVHNLRLHWWSTKGRQQLQTLADSICANNAKHAATINQAHMELGATICLPQNPKCQICPVALDCISKKRNIAQSLPLKKPKRKSEIWLWSPHVIRKGKKYLLVKNNYAPFLKNHWIWPGAATQLTKKVDRFDFKHSVTHHQIFVKITKQISKSNLPKMFSAGAEVQWVHENDLESITPASMVRKVLQYL